MDAGALAEALTLGSAAWPGVVVASEDWDRFLSARATSSDELKSLKVADLYLACACERADRTALRAFDATYGRDVAAAYGRFRWVGKSADDVKQELYEKLFTGDAPKIADYSGKGELRTWLRVTITRMLINMTTRETRERPTEEALLSALPGAAGDPELEHLRRTYAAELRQAFARAVAQLSSRERNLLHYACVEDLGIDAIGDLYGIHRSTAARWLEAARAALFKHLRAALLEQLRVNERELESIVHMMLSRVELTLQRYLAG
jgi:RNA polymerase sigma-70 factor (ECF subfamily)